MSRCYYCNFQDIVKDKVLISKGVKVEEVYTERCLNCGTLRYGYSKEVELDGM